MSAADVADGVSANAGARPEASRRLAVGTVVMALSNAGKIVVQFLLMPTIARLLGPSAYGVYSLATPSVMFVLMLADAGLGSSLAREDEDHELIWSSAFWLLMVLGAGLAIVLALWSIPLGILAHQPKLPEVMAPLSITVILLALCVSPDARLIRRSRIEVYGLIDFGTTMIAALAALVAAYFKAGVWSMVIQMLLLYGLRAISLNVMAFRLPKFMFSWRAVLPHTQVGGGIVITKLTESMGKALEVGIVARRFEVAAVGAFGFAGQASWSFVQSIGSPLWMALYVHTLKEDTPSETEALYNQLLRLMFVLTVPASMIVGALAGEIVPRFLGPSWRDSILFFALIFPTQAIGSCGQLGGATLYARGKTKARTILAFIYAGARLASVAIPFGGWRLVAVYMAAVNVGYFFLGLVNTKILLGWSLSKSFAALRVPALAGTAGAAAAYVAINRCGPTLFGLIVSGAIGAEVFLGLFVLLDWERVVADVKGVQALLRKKRGRDPA